MKRAEAIEQLQNCIDLIKQDGKDYLDERDIPLLDMAIEALSKPNYETDTEVRLAVTNRNKDKVVLWDAFGEVEYYPNGEINCVHCPRYYETEDDIGVHSHCGGHGRLIDADALLDKLPKVYYGSTIHLLINDAPTISTDRPQGEWIDKGDDAECSICGAHSGTQFDGVEPIPRITTFCPHCGGRMKRSRT